ncbi:hypothetical protein ABT381_15665 [Streptomyces sp. NPDC000151]|uniref:hypothetical protein n=1 Tax=Streptomyces sp. NPDC000151 TaxID=3154244 RepID=UPI0033195DD7
MSERLESIFVPDDGPEAPSEAKSQALNFVWTWAEEVLRQVERVETTRGRMRSADRMHGDEPGIDQVYLDGLFRELWAAEHTLLWAAYQLERWRKRLDRERGHTEREYDRALQAARNVLEHLDAADFAGGRAVAPPWEPPQKQRKPQDPYRSLRKRGGLDLGIADDGAFCGIPSAELRERALGVVHSVEDDLADEVVDHLVELHRGR